MWESAVAGDLFADQVVGKIIDTINPTLPADNSLGVLLSALSAGFAFLGVPGGQAGNAAARIGNQVVTTAIGQAPGLVKTLLPQGPLDSKLVQIHEIQHRLGDVTEQFQNNLAATLNATLSDFDTFRDMTANGAFIGSQPSLNLSTTRFTSILKTYVVSQALQANNIIITVARNLTPYDLYHRQEFEWGNETLYEGKYPSRSLMTSSFQKFITMSTFLGGE